MKPIILLIGKSCGGKTTLANELEKILRIKIYKRLCYRARNRRSGSLHNKYRRGRKVSQNL